TYASGVRLVLSRLAAELELSSQPIREALRRLEAEGLVEFTRNVGAIVTAIDAVVYVETLEVLTLLEAAATAASAPLLTPEKLRELHGINEEMKQVVDAGDML